MAPVHWYVGFADSSLEIILNAENIDLYEITMEAAPGITFVGKTNSGNRHIAYLNLFISPGAKPVNLLFTAKPINRRPRYVKQFKFFYELRARNNWSHITLNEKDILYRIIVDRFSNGDEGNDNVNLHHKIRTDRNDPAARHGGDLKGILNHTEYLKNLGITTVWINPIQENDHANNSQLGYSVSNHYSVDPRLGNNDVFQKLCADLRKKNLKSIMDINPNDFSTNHWLYQNFDTGWFNNWDTILHPDFTSYSINDPYYSPGERMRAVSSWVDRFSPDVNQDNAHMKKYLDQVYLWWLEYSGISGYCINRVALFSHEYLEHLMQRIKQEFPNASVITDTKTNSVAAQASMVKNNIVGFEGNLLASIPDYHLHRVYRDLLSPEKNLTSAVSALYMALSDDILYQKPAMHLSFLDNSLEKRAIDHSENDIARWKLACALMFTLRGIPAVYYGTEILLSSNYSGPQPAQIDFPGGWRSDDKNKFQASGRSTTEQDAYDYLLKLIACRNANPVLTNGKMMQYPVEKGIYVYFRYDEKNSFMVITNSNKTAQIVDLTRFNERTRGYVFMTEVTAKTNPSVTDPLEVPAGQTLIFQLR
jgi:glycosidase